MSATTGLAKQADGLEKLLALASLRKEDIAAAGEETRKQMQLTQEEEAKVATARAYISTHYALSSSLQHREEALAATISAHAKDVADFKSHVASENARLEAFASKLDARDKEIAEIDKIHIQKSQELISQKTEQDRQHQESIASIQRAEAKNNIDMQTNIKEASRLQDWENTLKRKAEITRQQLANF